MTGEPLRIPVMLLAPGARLPQRAYEHDAAFDLFSIEDAIVAPQHRQVVATGVALGLPPGVASITQQMQAFFTVLLAALFLQERPNARQITGMCIAFAGLALIGTTIGGDLTGAGLLLGLGSAFSWAVGNILVKRNPGQSMLPFMVWLSLVPPLPALVVSYLSATYPRHPLVNRF